MILRVHTTIANEHDIKGLEPLLKKTSKRHKEKDVWTDIGYKIPNNDKLLNDEKLKTGFYTKLTGIVL